MENFVDIVKQHEKLAIAGVESLSLGEGLSLFFKEFGTSIDSKLAKLSSNIHKVDSHKVKTRVANNKISYVKNVGVEILTPEGFTPSLGAMMNHTREVSQAVYLLSMMRTEASRLYDWLKQIVRKGRIDSSFKWSISDFDNFVVKAEDFVKNLPEQRRNYKHSLGSVYVNFGEYYEVCDVFNQAVKSLKHRDLEVASRELNNVYSIGTLLVTKVKENDILVSKESLASIEDVVDRFSRLTNITGAMLGLLNELSAVLTSQGESISKLKK